MAQSLAGTGIAGLDSILGGGLPTGHIYLVEGAPGSGKTTLATQFLLEGARRGERVLYITLSETEDEMRQVAGLHGWDLRGVTVRHVRQETPDVSGQDRYTVFHPSEVELGDVAGKIIDAVESLRPSRVVIDPISELRLLAADLFRYRRELIRLKQFFSTRDCTVLLLDDSIDHTKDLPSRTVVHGVLALEQMATEYGADRRRLRVYKLRGACYNGGFHDFAISTGGIKLFPRMVATAHGGEFEMAPVSTGIGGLDALLGGGLDAGTTTLFTGPAGTGKSSVALQVTMAAVARGHRAVVYAFEENLRIVAKRARVLGGDFEAELERGRIMFRHTDPAELSPGEFAHVVRESVEHDGARVVVIDSLNGYLNAMPEERFLIAQLHELLGFLNNHGVVTILILALPGLVSAGMTPPVDVSYLTDSVLLFRHFETRGELHTAVSVLKKRTGNHERTIRELRFTEQGLDVGGALSDFSGVLTGVPTYTGSAAGLGKGSA